MFEDRGESVNGMGEEARWRGGLDWMEMGKVDVLEAAGNKRKIRTGIVNRPMARKASVKGMAHQFQMRRNAPQHTRPRSFCCV